MDSRDFKSLVLDRQIKLIDLQPKGLLKDLLLYHYQRPGKMIRTELAARVAKSLDVNQQAIVDWCATCEMLHNATLIHDDLQDGDVTRRGQNSVWKMFGENQAINGGDFLLSAAPSLILGKSLSATTQLSLFRIYSEISTGIVRGQSIEFTLREHLDSPSLQDAYQDCISLKTGQLFSGLIEGIGVIANIESNDRADLIIAFKQLGIAFQIQDDILDLFGDKKRGEVGCDIKEGKVSCLVIQYLQKYPEDHFNIMPTILKQRDQTSESETNSIIELFRSCGVLDACLDEFNSRTSFVKKLSFIARNKKLGQVIEDICQLIAQPIGHLQRAKQRELEITR